MEEQQQPLQIICLQTHMTHYHYQSYPILKKYLLKCIHHGINLDNKPAQHPTIVIFPECIGIWLYLMCVPMPKFLHNYFFNYNNIKINHHILFIIYTLITHIRLFCKEIYQNYHMKCTWLGLIKRSWFNLFAEQTYLIYKKLFSELSYETNCTIVAGSIFINNQNLYNISCVF